MGKRPQPLLSRAAIASSVGVVLYLGLRLVGVEVGTETVETAADAVAGLIVAAGPIVAAFMARSKVTPVSDPRGEFGETLEPAALAGSYGHDIAFRVGTVTDEMSADVADAVRREQRRSTIRRRM